MRFFDNVNRMSMKHVIELIDISLANSAGVKVLDNFNFSLRSGETVLICGSPGMKRIALVELIIGSYAPDSGAVLVFEKRLNIRKERALTKMRKKIGGVGGIFDLVSYQSVIENINYPLILKPESASSGKKKVIKILTDYGLLGKKEEKAINLSRGDKILAMLARATIANQPLLIIDEPLAGLDSDMASKVIDILKNLSVAGHSMLILTTDSSALPLPDAIEFIFEDGHLR
jgi:ABC-type ATPase involved in cell division